MRYSIEPHAVRSQKAEKSEANNRTLKLLVRHRIQRLYEDKIRFAFTHWLSVTSTQSASEVDKATLKMIMRHRIKELVMSHQRHAFGMWARFTSAMRIFDASVEESNAPKELRLRSLKAM